MGIKELISIKTRLETVREKTASAPAKGDESPSLYYRHINEQLQRKEAK